MDGITKEWLEQEIKRLEELNAPAIIRFVKAKEAFKAAKESLDDARSEMETIAICKKELEWQLAVMQEKEAQEVA